MNNHNMEEIYLSYAKIVYKYLLSLTCDEDVSEELTQETFYQASLKIKSFRGECKISVWLCQIAKYTWYKELNKRKHKTISIHEVDYNLITVSSIEYDYFKNVDKIELFNKIHLLNDKTKEVIFLRLTGELSFSEIGEIIGESENWARVTYYRGKQKILEGRLNER